MAIDDPTLSMALRSILDPNGLMDPICDVLLELEGRFFVEVARLAMSKPRSGDRWVVQREELLLAAQNVLNAATAEVATALDIDDTGPMRRTAA